MRKQLCLTQAHGPPGEWRWVSETPGSLSGFADRLRIRVQLAFVDFEVRLAEEDKPDESDRPQPRRLFGNVPMVRLAIMLLS